MKNVSTTLGLAHPKLRNGKKLGTQKIRASRNSAW
jgi:hypothetical protein